MNEENEINIEGMSSEELANLLIEHPEMSEEILSKASNLKELYEKVEDEVAPSMATIEKAELAHDQASRVALKSIVDYLQNRLGYEDFDEYEEMVLTDEQLDFVIDRVDEHIENGATPEQLEELCKKYGYKLGDFYSPEILKDRYLYYGFDYDIVSGSLTPVSKETEE